MFTRIFDIVRQRTFDVTENDLTMKKNNENKENLTDNDPEDDADDSTCIDRHIDDFHKRYKDIRYLTSIYSNDNDRSFRILRNIFFEQKQKANQDEFNTILFTKVYVNRDDKEDV